MSIVYISKLTNKICKEYGLDADTARSKAQQITKGCPQALWPNLCEWSEERPLSDIYVGKYTLPMILAIWNSKDFLRALEVMKELCEGKTETAELKIWEMRR